MAQVISDFCWHRSCAAISRHPALSPALCGGLPADSGQNCSEWRRLSALGHPTPPIEISNFRSGLRKFIKLFQLLSSGWKITQVASFGENWPRRVHFRAIFRHRTSHANLRTPAITREFPSPPRAESMFGEREVAWEREPKRQPSLVLSFQ